MNYFPTPIAIFLTLPSAGTGFARTFDHSAYDSLLSVYVENGLVDYKAIQADRTLLTTYLDQLENVHPDDFRTWSENEQKAFWINAYNAITIEGILRHYPIKPGGFIDRRRFPKEQYPSNWRVLGHDVYTCHRQRYHSR